MRDTVWTGAFQARPCGGAGHESQSLGTLFSEEFQLWTNRQDERGSLKEKPLVRLEKVC